MGASLLGSQLNAAQEVLAKDAAGVSLDRNDLSVLREFRSGVETLLNPDPTRKLAAARASDVLHATIMATPYVHFSMMDQVALDRVLAVQGRNVYCVLTSGHGSDFRFDSHKGYEGLLPGPAQWTTLEEAHKQVFDWVSIADTIGGDAAIVSMPAVVKLFRANPELVFRMPFVPYDTLSICERLTPDKINSGGNMTHEGTIGVPVRPELLTERFSPEQLREMAFYIGDAELRRLALDKDHTPENEGRNLLTVREAVYAVIGRGAEAPWIIGFASEFANGLLKVA